MAVHLHKLPALAELELSIDDDDHSEAGGEQGTLGGPGAGRRGHCILHARPEEGVHGGENQ